MAKKLTNRLLQLGASQMIETGLGDYQHDFEYQGEFDPWLEAFWAKLGSNKPKSDSILPPIY
jgi:sulfite reductase alpha subunit-like flavoprotein